MILALIMASGLATAPIPAQALPSPERRQELLSDAAKLGRVDLIPALIQAGADVNGHDARGFTPLILAAYNKQAEALELLIASGANPCKPDATQGNTAQMGVAFKGDDALAARLLKEKCDVNARNRAGQTALMMASLFGRTEQIEMLLKAGADPAAVDASGRSAASVAGAQGHDAVRKKLEGESSEK